MKKLEILGAIVAGAMLLSGVAMAADNVNPYAKAEYQYQNGRDSQSDASGAKFTVGNQFNANWAAEVSSETMQKQSTKALTTYGEIAVIPSLAFGSGFTGYARVATGAAWASGSNSFNYYSIEPGVKYDVAPGTAVKVAYRYRDAYDNTANPNFQTHVYRLGLEQSLAKNVSATVGYDRSYGDSKYDAVLVGLNVKF
jgi:opacity protein-like surface antigen